jgi:branched-chain amino acid transport system ATP-binding protein
MCKTQIVKLSIANVSEGRQDFSFTSVYDNLMTGAFLRNDRAGIARNLEKAFECFAILRSTQKQQVGSAEGDSKCLLFGGLCFPILDLLSLMNLLRPDIPYCQRDG